VSIQFEDFDVAAEYQALTVRCAGGVGAIVSFVGLVRDRHDSAEVETLYLEHYPGMTERSVEKIVTDAGERWPLDDVVVVHRVGALAAAEQIVFVQVASRHRDGAFAAAEFIMDYLKTDAVFWKREDRSSDTRWVESTGTDRQRRSNWERQGD